MRYDPHERGRIEALLAERAEALLRERAAQTGISPRRLINQIVPAVVEKPRAGQIETESVVAQLLARLKDRD